MISSQPFFHNFLGSPKSAFTESQIDGPQASIKWMVQINSLRASVIFFGRQTTQHFISPDIEMSNKFSCLHVSPPRSMTRMPFRTSMISPCLHNALISPKCRVPRLWDLVPCVLSNGWLGLTLGLWASMSLHNTMLHFLRSVGPPDLLPCTLPEINGPDLL
jgi:hypothetical protein